MSWSLTVVAGITWGNFYCLYCWCSMYWYVFICPGSLLCTALLISLSLCFIVVLWVLLFVISHVCTLHSAVYFLAVLVVMCPVWGGLWTLNLLSASSLLEPIYARTLTPVAYLYTSRRVRRHSVEQEASMRIHEDIYNLKGIGGNTIRILHIAFSLKCTDTTHETVPSVYDIVYIGESIPCT